MKKLLTRLSKGGKVLQGNLERVFNGKPVAAGIALGASLVFVGETILKEKLDFKVTSLIWISVIASIYINSLAESGV